MSTFVEDHKRIRDRISRLTAAMESIAQAAVDAGAAVIAAEVRRRAPSRTGSLRRSVRVDSGRVASDATWRGFIIGIDAPRGIPAALISDGMFEAAPVGKFLEFGTSKMQARPFMGPAYAASKNAAIAASRERTRELIGNLLKS